MKKTMKLIKIAMILFTPLLSIAQRPDIPDDEVNFRLLDDEQILMYNASLMVESGTVNISNLIDLEERGAEKIQVKGYEVNGYNNENEHRFLVYSRSLKKTYKSYLPKNIQEKLKLEFLNETINNKNTNSENTSYKYRNCDEGLTYEIFFYKKLDLITVGIQWFSENNRVKEADLRGCKFSYTTNYNKTNSNALYKGRRNQSIKTTDKNNKDIVSDWGKRDINGRATGVVATEKEIKSKIYDLEKYAHDKYLSSYNIQREEIIKYFTKESNYSTEKFPSFKSIINSKVPYHRFRNTYNIKYRLKDNSRESVIRNGIVSAGTRDIKTLKEIELISGNDSELALFKYASISIPTIKIEGYEVMTEAKFNNVKVDFTRGITEVKIKKKNVDFKKYPPEKDIQELITNELKAKGVNGKFLVKYEIQDIMGQSNVSIQLEKK